MASISTIARSGRALAKPGTCVFCLARQSRPAVFSRPSALQHARSINLRPGPSAPTKKRTGDLARYEAEVRARAEILNQMRSSKLLAFPPQTAETFIEEFRRLPGVDIGAEMKDLATRYNIALADLVMLGHGLMRTQDVKSKQGVIYRSTDKALARDIWMACCKAGEPKATTHLISAVLFSSKNPAAAAIAKALTQQDLQVVFEHLNRLVAEKVPEAMAQAGQLAEQEGKRKQARDLYLAAIEASLPKKGKELVFDTGKQGITFPITPPWISLATMYLEEKDHVEEARKLAKEYLEVGAEGADDPLAWYLLTKYEQPYSANWLKWTTRAAASGHPEAMYNLSVFYTKADEKSNPVFRNALAQDSQLEKFLKWLVRWKPAKSYDLADEWLNAAANNGNVPAMVKIAETLEGVDKLDQAESWLKRAAASGVAEYSTAVEEAKKMLNSPKYAAKKTSATS